MITCKLCNVEFKAISSTHLKSRHGLSCKEYLERFPGEKIGTYSKEVLDNRYEIINKKRSEKISKNSNKKASRKGALITHEKRRKMINYGFTEIGIKVHSEKMKEYNKIIPKEVRSIAGKRGIEARRKLLKFGFTEAGLKNIKESCAKTFKGKSSWSKGLTKETDERVRAISENPERIAKIKFASENISAETRKKLSLAGGGTGIPYENSEYSFEFNDSLKERIRRRDNYECQNCNLSEEEHLMVYGRNLIIHHINYNKRDCHENNLIALCIQCNIRANYNRDFWKVHYTKIVCINESTSVLDI